ncbi:MAG: glycosyltransferase, partial [Acidobacteriota bacterium]|nr:glycosyltransferase [Acidobacteriota bacterium]
MRIGIAASEMEGEATGVGRAVAGLLDGLAESDFDGSVVAYFRGSRFDHPLWDDPRFEPRFSASGASPVVWEQRQLPSQIGDVDLFLGPAYALPRRLPCPGVVIIHDLSFEVLPDEFGLRERWRRRWLARRAAHQAARVLTVSGRVASEIEARYGTPASKIGVLRWG